MGPLLQMHLILKFFLKTVEDFDAQTNIQTRSNQ